MLPEPPDNDGYWVPFRILRANLRQQLPEGTAVVALQWTRQEARESRDADGWLCVGTLHAEGRNWGAWWHPERHGAEGRELREISGTPNSLKNQ